MPELAFEVQKECPENIRSVFNQCIKSLKQRQEIPLPGDPHIALVLNGMSKASAVGRYLAGRKSPKGEIVSDGDGNTQIVSFAVLDLLAWMAAQKFVKVSQVVSA